MIIRVIEKEKWTNKKRPCFFFLTRALYFGDAKNRFFILYHDIHDIYNSY